MSPPILKPWIKNFVVDLLSFDRDTSIPSRHPSRCVQVISTNVETRSITISDKEVYIQTFLSKECFEELTSIYSVEALKFNLVNLDNYCFSTVTQVSGNQNIMRLKELLIPHPMALQCFKISYLGGIDLDMIGEPRPLNDAQAVKALLKNYKYPDLTRRLAIVQFPLQKRLPDWGKLASVFHVKNGFFVLFVVLIFLQSKLQQREHLKLETISVRHIHWITTISSSPRHSCVSLKH